MKAKYFLAALLRHPKTYTKKMQNDKRVKCAREGSSVLKLCFVCPKKNVVPLLHSQLVISVLDMLIECPTGISVQ